MDSLQLVDELERLGESGEGGWLGACLVSEAGVSNINGQLRALVSSAPALQILGEIEHLVQEGKSVGRGKRAVNEVEFFAKILQLRASLSPSSAPASSSVTPSLRLIDELEQVVESGFGGWLGTRFVNGEEVLKKIVHLRMATSDAAALQLTDELEHLVENGKFRWLGKSGINEEAVFVKIQQLRSVLSSHQ